MLKNHIAMITGCSGGIGLKTLEIFSKNNADIIACSRKLNKSFEDFCRKLEKKYQNKIYNYYFDVLDEKNFKEQIDDINQNHQNIDVLVNAAGQVSNDLFQMTTYNKFKEIFEINYFSQIKIIQFVLKKMTKNKRGSIVNISSSSAFEYNVGRSAYSSSKSAIIALSNVLSREVGRYNIRVNTVSPGLTNTKMLHESSTKETIDQKIKEISLKRIAEPEEIAKTILFLASDQSSYVTGEVLKVDGGL